MSSLPPPPDIEEVKQCLLSLSSTELMILYHISDLKTSKQIAEELVISPYTVNSHCSRIRNKLGLKGQKALLKFSLSAKGQLLRVNDRVLVRID